LNLLAKFWGINKVSIILSICIPTYNRVDLLAVAIESVLVQVNELNREKLEIVIADNSSNGETATWVNQLQAGARIPIVYHKNEQNIGFDRNLLTVVELAHGDYCWLLGDDDLLNPGAIDYLLKEISAEPAVDVFMGDKEDYDATLSHRMRFVSLFSNNRDRIFNFSQDGLDSYFRASQKLICFFNYISILIFKRQKWLAVSHPEQCIDTGYLHVYMMMSILFSGDMGVLKYLAKAITRRRWSKDRIPNIATRLFSDVSFFHLVAQKILPERCYVRAIDRLVIKNDAFSWAVRARIVEGFDFYTKTFPFLLKYYWSYALFWLKIVPLLFAPAWLLVLMRNSYLKFVKRQKLPWRDLFQNDLGYERDAAIWPLLGKHIFGRQNELSGIKRLVALEPTDLVPHVASDLGLGRYIKNADRIKRYLPQGRILDWGCGLGQMSYLLKNRGFEVVSFDLDTGGRKFLEQFAQPLVLGRDPVKLPFFDAEFDAILSSGVLEHVADPLASLEEIRRVMKPKGLLFIFRLPNRYSYIEFISDRLRRGDHPVKYAKKEICALLEQFGFKVLQFGYQGLLPYNLKGFPAGIRKFYHFFDWWIEKFDGLLSALPILKLVSTNLEVVAQKKPE